MRIVAMVLAGGTVPGMEVLSSKRTKAAVPFGGAYRIIDFALTNLASAGILQVGVLTQHRPESLMSHLANGAAWGMVGLDRTLRALPPYTGDEENQWYRGSADAVAQNLDFIRDRRPDHVLVVSGDHVYRMDYQKVIEHHLASGADVTLAVQRFKDLSYPSRFGIAQVENGRVTRYVEKPGQPCGEWVSLSVYLFRTEALLRCLDRQSHPEVTDFGKHVLPDLVRQRRVGAYEFPGIWLYLGDLHSYWKAHMDLLAEPPLIDMSDWGIRTNLDDRSASISPPPFLGSASQVEGCILGPGCVVEGTLKNSVVFGSCHIAAGAVVRDSVLMHGTVVEPRARLAGVVADKDCRIGEAAAVGCLEEPPGSLGEHPFPTTLGKSVKVPAGIQVGAGCIVFPGVGASELTGVWIPPDSIIKTKDES
jgi:glucose-1-phosphate adenylyltransferase